ncbi:MAG: glycosyltransferase family 4 protein [Myxococcota bacterium]
MRICYIVADYFKWGQFGGYGVITRALAEGLVERGHEVSALVPKRTEQAKREQRDVERVEGVRVFGLPHSYAQRLRRRDIYRRPEADLYVSVDARFDSWLAMRMNPRARHCIWFIDVMDFETFWNQHNEDPAGAGPLAKLRTRAILTGLQRFARRAARRADAVFSQPHELPAYARAFYGPDAAVRFAPNPVAVPSGEIVKSERPLVLFLARFDWQKQPETFFALAERFPDVEFVAAGAAADRARDADLRSRFPRVANLTLPGVVVGAEKDALLRRAWILCNTSLREGLPRSFQEAMAYRCALVAAVDPDRVVSRFGYHAAGRDFAAGLRTLFDGERWRELGRAGQEYIRANYERERALDVHEALYRQVLSE